ncbi:MAG: cytochrome c biogenesis protein ResB [Deltaproteobacteria bacterium]|nr:cytochrome c biogenesis protein ResB [Deltaproteobacteria bacterium]
MQTKLYRLFSSVRLAIFLFLALAVTSIFGTLVQQGLPLERYEKIFSPDVFVVLKFFNVFDMYHSWWFTLLLVLLSINILACTFKQTPRVMNLTFPRKREIDDSVFTSSQIRKTWHSQQDLSDLEEQTQVLLKSLAGTPVQVKKINDARYFFAERGKYSCLGMVFVHVSILFILGGGLIGTIWGFSGQMNVVEGTTSDTVLLFSGTGTEKLGFDVRCDDFTVDFYEMGMPKEYRTDVTILEGGKKVASGTIRVNHPLIYNGLKFCQATYGIAGIDNFRIVVQNSRTGKKTGLTMGLMEKAALPESTASFAITRFVPNQGGEIPAVMGVLLEPGKAHDIFWIEKNKRKEKGDFTFTLQDFDKHYYTGIQVSKDPGVPFVWTGFSLILSGFILSLFFAHTRVWLRIAAVQGGYEISLAADVSKNKKVFREKLEGLIGTLQQGGAA